MFSPLEQFGLLQVSLIPGLSNSSIAILGIGIIMWAWNELLTNTPWSIWMVGIIKIHNELLTMTNAHLGRQTNYFPFVWSLFNFIGLSNLTGLTPLVFPPTAQAIITLGISFSIWLGVIIIGIHNHGTLYSGGFIPVGTPTVLAILMVPIELLSFTASGISLGLSLCINVTAGHLLQIIIGEFAQTLFQEGINNSSFPFLIGALFPLGVIWALLHLELGIMIMQAYVFTTLTIIYIAESEFHH